MRLMLVNAVSTRGSRVLRVYSLAVDPACRGQGLGGRLIRALVAAGASIKTFDPQGMDNARKVLADIEAHVTFCHSVADATKGADVIAVVTEWNEFITQDWQKIAKTSRRVIERVIFVSPYQYDHCKNNLLRGYPIVMLSGYKFDTPLSIFLFFFTISLIQK